MAVAPTFAPLGGSPLFTPFKLGQMTIQHRIAQAPATRMRATKDHSGINIPGPIVAQYYSDRTTRGGFQITEATDISRLASGYPNVPGVFSASQLQAWRAVTDAVHAKGGYIFVQLWHTGRASSSGMRGGEKPVSSGVKAMEGKYMDGTSCEDGPPRGLTVEEIGALTREWAEAARGAVDVAGFDGVEIHGANGYLLEQFVHDNINTRTDEFGGSVENRCRFVLDVVKAIAGAIGPEKTGIRLSPYNYFQGTRDSDPNKHWAYLCTQLANLPVSQRPVYVHMVEPRFDEVLNESQKLTSLPTHQICSLTPFRSILRPAGISFLACGSFNRDNAAAKVESEGADMIVFARHFVANPDLVERLKHGWELNVYDRSTFYGAEPKERGYNDYPFYGKGVGA